MNDESKDAQASPDVHQTDWHLQILVKIVNDAEERFSLPITILVGGTLVSGALIGVKEYFDAFPSRVAGMFPDDPEASASAREMFSMPEDLLAAPAGDALPQYIHIRDAKFYTGPGNPVVAGDGVLWRGRIAHVGGFNFGSLAPLPK